VTEITVKTGNTSRVDRSLLL